MNTSYNYNIGSLEHLYFVEKIDKKRYQAKCLFTGETIIFENKKELERNCQGTAGPNRLNIDFNAIFQDTIKKTHQMDYTYEEVKEFVDNLLLNDITISNAMIINEFNLFLFSLDLSAYRVCVKRTNNPFLVRKYKQRIMDLEEIIKYLENIKNDYQNQKKKIKV